MDLDGTDPLAAIVVQSHCDTVAGAGTAGCSRIVVHVEETVWVVHVDAIDSILPDVRLGVCGHEADNGVEVRVEVVGGTHDGDGDGVGVLLQEVQGCGNIGGGNRSSRERDTSPQCMCWWLWRKSKPLSSLAPWTRW